MPQPNRTLARAAHRDARSWIAAGLWGGMCLAWTLAGGCGIAACIRGPHPAWLAPLATLLAACGALQAYWLKVLWPGKLSVVRDLILRTAFARHLLLAIAAGYLVALVVGPGPFVGLVWIATVAVLVTVLLLPLAASPSIVDDWRRWVQDRTPRRLTWLVAATLLVLATCELGLRAERSLRFGDPTDQLPSLMATAEASPEPFDLNRLKLGRFRVAVLDDGLAADNKLIRRVAQALPGADIVPLPEAHDTSRSSASVSQQITASRPDLVLAVLPVCEDLAQPAPERSLFDWRQLELVVRVLGEGEVAVVERPAAGDFESFLDALAPQLVACRTPISSEARERWQRMYDDVDRIAASCREADVPLALVVVPGEFQVNHQLRDTLLRRAGIPADRFDAELPQRQLAGYAHERKLPVIDLLPHLRLCREAVYERNATALNDQGHQAAATAIGGWLHSRYGGQLAAQLSKTP